MHEGRYIVISYGISMVIGFYSLKVLK